MPIMSDPRIFFAAERTLLAWLRTGLAVIGLGFVVARFGLFLRMLGQPHSAAAPSPWSLIIGVFLVLLGAVMVGGAAWQHARFSRELAPAERPERYWLGFGLLMAVLVSGCGFALAVYLLSGAAQE
jgi:putative membrane protein